MTLEFVAVVALAVATGAAQNPRWGDRRAGN